MIVKALRAFVFLLFTGLGALLGQFLTEQNFVPKFLMNFWPHSVLSICILISSILGVFLAPPLANKIIKTTHWLEQKLHKTPLQEIIGGVTGLIIGLIIAVLLGSAFSDIPYVGGLIKSLGALLLGYLGLSVGIKKREELLSAFSSFPKFGRDKQGKDKEKNLLSYKILDTSVIIDGRIADLCQSGFVEGVLVIPGFVLEELRHIADSSDLLKRNRGRRGLDILNKIRKELEIPVQINEQDFEDIAEVDSKLVRLAQVLNAKVLTNDYNLNKVAELQGVQVLNINELSNAIKPVVLPGEEMVVQVIKDGKESGQGVAYLDDGTMIVVDGGKKYIGMTISVLVTSVLQTAAGRMIFAKPKTDEKRQNEASSRHFNEVNLLG